MSSLNPSYRKKANVPNTQMTGPEDKHDRDHNGTGRPGVGEKRKLKKTKENWSGTVDRMRSNCFFSKAKIKRLGRRRTIIEMTVGS
jgi:hypothetical protein